VSAALKSKEQRTKGKREVDIIRGCDQSIERIRVQFESTTYAATPHPEASLYLIRAWVGTHIGPSYIYSRRTIQSTKADSKNTVKKNSL